MSGDEMSVIRIRELIIDWDSQSSSGVVACGRANPRLGAQ